MLDSLGSIPLNLMSQLDKELRRSQGHSSVANTFIWFSLVQNGTSTAGYWRMPTVPMVCLPDMR